MSPKCLFKVSECVFGLLVGLSKVCLFSLVLMGMKQCWHLTSEPLQDLADDGKIFMPNAFRSRCDLIVLPLLLARCQGTQK